MEPLGIEEMLKQQKAAQAPMLDKPTLEKQVGAPISDADLKGTMSMVRGAGEVVKAGANPLGVNPEQLKQVDPVKPTAEEDSGDTDKQTMILKSIMAIAPTILGGAFGGKQGAAIGAESTGKFFTGVAEREQKTLDKQAEAKAKVGEKAAEFEMQKKLLGVKGEQEEKQMGTKFGYDTKLKEMEMQNQKAIKTMEAELEKTKSIPEKENKLRQEFSSNEMTKTMQSMTGNMQALRQLRDQAITLELAKKGTGFVDTAMTYTYAKTLDPRGAVQKGDVENAQSNASAFERLGINIDNILKGGKLTDAQRAALVSATEDIYKGQLVPFQTYKSQMEAIADRQGVNKENVFYGFGEGADTGKKEAPRDPLVKVGGKDVPMSALDAAIAKKMKQQADNKTPKPNMGSR